MTDEKIAVAKALPAIAGAAFYGLTLQEWVAIATLAYIALQVGLLLPKYWTIFAAWRARRKQRRLF